MTGEHVEAKYNTTEEDVLKRLRSSEHAVVCPCLDLRKAAAAEIESLRRDLAQEKRRSFQDGRITYKGFNYGVGSQWGIDSLRRAIEGNGHG